MLISHSRNKFLSAIDHAEYLPSSISIHRHATISTLMGSVSGRSNIAVTVTRKDPIGDFETSPIRRAMIIGGATGTYCQMQDESLNPFAAGDIGGGAMALVRVVSGGSDYVLAPFGGLPGGDPKCD